MAFEGRDKVRLGLIGVGGRGNSHLNNSRLFPTCR